MFYPYCGNLQLLFWFCLFTTKTYKLIYVTSHDQTRLSYGGPSIVKHYCYPRNKETAELGSTFKAVHVKSLLWWLALRTREASLKSPEESCPQHIFFFGIGVVLCNFNPRKEIESLLGLGFSHSSMTLPRCSTIKLFRPFFR